MTEKELIKNSIERYAPDPAGFSAEETVNRAKNRARVRPHRSWAVAAVTAAAAAAVGFALFLWSKSDMRVTPGEEQDNSAAEIVTSAPDSSLQQSPDDVRSGCIMLDLTVLSDEERENLSREFSVSSLPGWEFKLTGSNLSGARYLVNDEVPTKSCIFFSDSLYTVTKLGIRDISGDGTPEIFLECFRSSKDPGKEQEGSMVTVIDLVREYRVQYYVPNMMSCSLEMQDGVLKIKQERQQPYSKMYLVKDTKGNNGLTLGGYNNESDAVTYFDPAEGQISPEYEQALKNKYVYTVYSTMNVKYSEGYHFSIRNSEVLHVGENSTDTVNSDFIFTGSAAAEDPKVLDCLGYLTSSEFLAGIEPIIQNEYYNTQTAYRDAGQILPAGSGHGSFWLTNGTGDGVGVAYTVYDTEMMITVNPPENEGTMDQLSFLVNTNGPFESERYIPEEYKSRVAQNSLAARNHSLLMLMPKDKRVITSFDGMLKVYYTILLEETEEGVTKKNPSGQQYVFRVDSIENNTDIPTEKLRLSYGISSPGDNSGETELKEGLELVLSSAAKPAKGIYMRILSDSWEDSIMSLNIVVSD